MPTYDFSCPNCKTIFERTISISRREEPLNEPCPNCHDMGVERYYGNQLSECADPYNIGRIKPPGDWREFLRKMKKDNPGASNINEF